MKTKDLGSPVGMALATLVEAFKVKPEDMTAVRIRIYSRALAGVPPQLLQPMVDRAVQTRVPRWGDLPAVKELLEDAEACRRELLAANPHEPCEACNETGWADVVVDGVKRVSRCACWKAWQHKLSTLGITTQPLALPPAQSGGQGATE